MRRYGVHKARACAHVFYNKFKGAVTAPGVRATRHDGEVLQGRVCSAVKRSSKKLGFFDLQTPGGGRVQVVVDAKHCGDVVDLPKLFDIVRATGFPGRTRHGQLSLFATKVEMLAPSDVSSKAVSKDARHVEMLLRPEGLPEILKKRAFIIQRMRQFWVDLGLVEVETPILTTKTGGAAATPFKTTTGEFLRISPELHLKRLVVGGLDGVFEIGKVFRNEGLSRRHNPEFTMCEAYRAHSDYAEMMKCVEDLLRVLDVEVSMKFGTKTTKLSCTDEYRVLSVVDELVTNLGLPAETFTSPHDHLSTLNEVSTFLRLRSGNDDKVLQSKSALVLLDAIIGEVVESRTMGVNCPTFLIKHPSVLSPLALEDSPGVAARFELFVDGAEIANAYSELNDPQEQLNNFAEQHLDSRDDEYVEALRCGLPPTAGIGIGIDRLVMLLTRKSYIREVIAFPK